MTRLDRLLRPKSIAVVGGGFWGTNVIEQCRKIGFSGDIWAVHPKRNRLAGLATYPTIDDLPGVPDATFIGVNRHGTIEAVRRLAELGAGGAICFAAGFREVSGEDASGDALQDSLIQAAGSMPIIGPNCYGILNYLDGAALWPDQHGGKQVGTGTAIITQSSNIAINLTMQKRGLPIAYVVTAGNQAQTNLSEIGVALLGDPRVTALGLHIEGIGDIREFEALALEARRLGKSIVALKVGASDQARTAAISHTASLAGSNAGARAIMARLGVAQVSSLSALLETLKILHVTGPLQSGRIASLSCSGGEASLMADAAHGTALTFPPLNTRQLADLGDALGPAVALANPLDYNTHIWGDETALTQTFSAMMGPGLALGVIVLDFPRADKCSAEAWEPVVTAAAKTRDASGKPMALLGSIAENMPEDVCESLIAQGIVPLCGLPESIEAIQAAVVSGQEFTPPKPVLLPSSRTAGVTLSEADAKAALATHRIRVPRSIPVMTPKDAAQAASKIGFPVALKGEGVAHKTETGAVRLDLATPDAVTSAAQDMACDGYLVEEMIGSPVAELLIGVVCDPAHGYVLTLAAGGTLTELLSDSASLLVPASRADTFGALSSLKIAPLLQGYRGARAADINAILDAIDAVQSYVQTERPLEVEINPLMCCTDGAVAADALIKTGENNA